MYFLIEQAPDLDHRYHFRLMRTSRDPLMVSELFTSKVDCLVAIHSVREAGVEIANYTLWDQRANYRFNLFYGEDSLLVGTIRYRSAEERDKAMQEIADSIAQADTRDQAPVLSLAA